MNNLATVVRFNNDSLWKDIEIWLINKECESLKTRRTYERSLRDFFTWKCNGKRLEDLVSEDLIADSTVFIDYQNHLSKNLGLKDSSINTKIGSIRSMYRFLEEKYPINMKWFNNVKRRKQKNSISYGDLTLEEVQQMIDIVSNSSYKGLEKSLLIKTAATTSFRKESLLQLRWSNITYSQEENLYILRTFLKGEEDIKAITPEDYEELIQLKKYNKDRVFSLSSSSIQNMMDKLKYDMCLDDNRHITFHSLKKVAINYASLVLHDIKAAQIQGNHKSVATTTKYYIKANKKMKDLPGLKMWQKVDTTIFKKVSSERLIEALKRCSISCQREIIEKLNQ